MEDIVGGFRKVIQDLLVPELKAVQVELKHHSEQFERIDKRFEAMQHQIDTRFEAMQQQIDTRFKAMQQQMNRRFDMVDKRFEAMQKDIQEIKIDLKGIIGIVDINTKFARMEGEIKNIQHMFLTHIGLEKKAHAA